MKSTDVHLHTRHPIGAVDRRIFGGFLEHMGRAVYQGVYEPESPKADAEGWRSDVLESLRGLDMTLMRYPGGNFVSGYHWQDGVGPRDQRPRVREKAWNSIESNQVGTDEFLQLADRMGWEPMMAVNLGTGTPEEAHDWVEYCNGREGTRYADLRVAHGRKEPYDIKLWCLGNEMAGDWQIGHVPAEEYALRAQQTAKLIKDLDPTIQLVASGSATTWLPSYLEWDRVVLEKLGDAADYLSLHNYVGNYADDTMDFLASPQSIERQISEVDSVCRYVQGKLRSKKRAFLAFDEWNVWYRTLNAEHTNGHGQFAPPLIEEQYNLEDALVVAGFLHAFVRNADVLKIANLAQIVNVIAPILTRRDDLLVQSIYWPFEMFSKRREGISLRPVVDGPSYESASHGLTQHVDASAILGDGQLHVFLTNRDDEATEVAVQLSDVSAVEAISAEILTGHDAKASNDWEARDVIRALPFEDLKIAGQTVTFELPPMSFVAATLRLG